MALMPHVRVIEAHEMQIDDKWVELSGGGRQLGRQNWRIRRSSLPHARQQQLRDSCCYLAAELGSFKSFGLPNAARQIALPSACGAGPLKF